MEEAGLMNWALRVFFSSIGKKVVMAITGLMFCLFLGVHLIGNLTLYGGEDPFLAYSARLHSLGPVVNIIELGLLLFAVLHVSLALILYIENLRARPVGYAVKKTRGGRTWSSALMPYTGLYLLLFVVIHLFTFHFVDRTNQTIYQLVVQAFSRPGYVIFYVLSTVVAAVHIKHGLWSSFQTIGANHPKYMPVIKGGSLLFSIGIAVGFGSIPLFVMVAR
jgi:succinate dehydrogenase / fumarate reductase cytochrome b subunit